MTARIARLAAADAPRYRQLMLDAYARDAEAFTSTPEEREAQPAAWWVARIADPFGRGVGFGAFDGDVLVGTVALEFETRAKTRHKATLLGMVVVPAARGAGVGRALVDTAIAHAAAQAGTRVLQLAVADGNEPAIRLYRGAGFEVYGREPLALRTAAGFKARLLMWRPIAADDDAS